MPFANSSKILLDAVAATNLGGGDVKWKVSRHVDHLKCILSSSNKMQATTRNPLAISLSHLIAKFTALVHKGVNILWSLGICTLVLLFFDSDIPYTSPPAQEKKEQTKWKAADESRQEEKPIKIWPR